MTARVLGLDRLGMLLFFVFWSSGRGAKLKKKKKEMKKKKG